MTARWPAPRREVKFAWQVIAVLGDGSSPGNCGHHHKTKEAAVMCPWEPDPWPDYCDLLVREVRDRRDERVRRRAYG